MRYIKMHLRNFSGRGRMVIILLLAYAMLGQEAMAQDGSTFTVGDRIMRIDSFNAGMEKIMSDVGIPGLSLAVIDKGKIVFSKTYGLKRTKTGEKADRNTIFEACSLSKSFLVFVAHQLVDEHKLDLDKPMYQYLPYPPLEHDQRYKLITPRMILCHSSGLENWRWQNNPDTLEILFNPGEKYNYSGEGYNYLALVIATILKEPYEKYIYDMVLKPLHLKRTFVKFETRKFLFFRKEIPRDYAMGNDIFSEEVEKFKNTEPIPSSNVQVTAKDYARLINAIFDGNKLSADRIKDILTPAITMDSSMSTYFGLGFGVIFNNEDTLIAQTGNNYGYKANFFYSPRLKRGFVYFSNGDRGLLVSQRLAEMTVGFHIGRLFAQDNEDQYPSQALRLFQLYREHGPADMLAALEEARRQGQLTKKSLDQLGEDFMFHDVATSRQVLKEDLRLYPESPQANEKMGRLYLSINLYDSALPFLVKANSLNPGWVQAENEQEMCESGIKDDTRRDSILLVVLKDNETVLRAENYNKMNGIQLEKNTDTEPGNDVGWIDQGDWLDYKVNVERAGDYITSLRISSPTGHAKVELRSADTSLVIVDIPATKSYSKWATVTTKVHLDAGTQTLRVYAVTSGFNINWVKFHPLDGVVNK